MPDVLSGSSAENGVNINKNAARQDAVPNVWFRDTCMVCQTVHKSDAEKSTHVACKTHVKRACVYQFFSKEVGRCTAVKVYSVLVKRYENARVSMAGLECIHELIVPFAQTPWWACSICYMAGCSLDSADAHLRSAEHQLTYLDEFHPNRVINRSSSRVDLLQQLFTVCCEVVEEQEGLQSPEVLQLNGVTKESASNILGLDETDEVKGFTRGDSFCGHYSIHCKACGEIIVTSSESEERCWNVHTARDYHQKMHAINCFVEQLENIPIENPFKNIVTTNIWQKCSDGTVLGPLTALQNLIYFGSYPYCILCHCVINPKQVVEHFRCENHITSVLATTNPSKVYSAQQKTDGRRRAIMQEMLETLSKQRPGGPPRKINTLSVPNHILLFSNSDIRNKPSIIPQILNLSVDVSRRFYYCPICWKLIPLQSEESDVAVEWCEHCVRSRRHGQNAVRREKFYFDEANFVDVVSTLKFGESENAEPVWMEASCDGVQVEIQKQTLVGLDWIVDDLSSNEVVCTVCAAIYKRSDINSIEVHIRSLDHLMQVLYNTDREMAALVKSQKTADIECSLLMDYLQRSLPSVGQVRVYSPKLAKQISKWGNIKLRTIELAIIPAASRPVYKALLDIVDHIADDRVENMEIPIKDALHFCSVRIHSLNDDSALLWCMQCRKAFTAFHSTVIDDTWQKHFSSESHFIRARSFMENRFEEDGFCHDSPSIKIPQLDQAALEKNVTWRWNEELHTYEYIYAIIGVSDMIECRSLNALQSCTPYIFCSLCAESVPCDQSAFEKHIRQRNHVTNFLHIHCIDAVRELELLLNDTSNDSRRALRRFLAQVLKNERNKSSEMRVYDPERMHRLKDNQVTVKQELKEQEEFQSASSKEDETGKQLCHQESSFVKRLSDAEVEESDQTKDAICLKSPCKKPRKEADQEERVIRSQILKNEKNEGECIASAGNVQKSSKTVNEQENTTFAPGNGQAEETDGASNSVAPPDTISLPTDVTMARGTPTDNSPSLNETSVPQQSSDKVSNHPISKAKRLKTSSELSTPGRDRGRSASSHRGSTRASSKMTINDVKTRDELVEFMWKQGSVLITDGSLPTDFNEAASKTPALLGLSSVYDVRCTDPSAFRSLYCSTCVYWSTFPDMLQHLASPTHRLNYFSRKYKTYSKTVMKQTNEADRINLLEKYAQQIWALKGSGKVRYRLRYTVDVETIKRVWPDYLKHSKGGLLVSSQECEKMKSAPKTEEKEKVDCSGHTRKDSREHGLTKKSLRSSQNEKRFPMSEHKISRRRRHVSKERRETGSRSRSRIGQRHSRSVSPVRYSYGHYHRTNFSRRSSRSPSPASLHRSPLQHSYVPPRDIHYSPPRHYLDDVPRVQRVLESSWNNAAAAFLERIGDKHAASRMLGYSSHRRSPHRRMQSIHGRSRSRGSSRSGSSSHHRLRSHSPEWRRCSRTQHRESSSDNRSSELLKRLESLVDMFEKIPRGASRVAQEPDSYEDESRSHNEKIVNQPKSSKEQPRDSHADVRKFLGFLVTMQQEVQRSGCLDASMIKQLSQEIGISQQSSSSSMDMLQQLARLLVPDSSCHGTEDTSSCVDLERFGIKTREQSPPVTGYFCGGATDPVPLRKEENNGLHLASFPGLRGPCDASRVPSSSQNPPTTWSPPTAIKTIFDQNTVKDNCNERQPQQVLAKELDIYAVRTRQGSNLGNTEIDFDDQCAGVRREATVSGLRPPTFDYAVSASSSTSLLDNPDASSKQEDSRKREQKLKMMLNYRRQLTMKPGLSQWTGANNRANFTSSPTKDDIWSQAARSQTGSDLRIGFAAHLHGMMDKLCDIKILLPQILHL